jgi:hypothetical protein
MAWRAITEDDVLTRISGAELAALRAAALGEDQEDPVDDVLTQITNMVRGYCAARASNAMGASGTIPEVLLGAALDLIVVEISKRAAGTLIDPEGTREEAVRNALRLLERVADGKFSVDDDGEDGTYQGTSGGASTAAEPASRFDRAHMKGL